MTIGLTGDLERGCQEAAARLASAGQLADVRIVDGKQSEPPGEVDRTDNELSTIGAPRPEPSAANAFPKRLKLPIRSSSAWMFPEVSLTGSADASAAIRGHAPDRHKSASPSTSPTRCASTRPANDEPQRCLDLRAAPLSDQRARAIDDPKNVSRGSDAVVTVTGSAWTVRLKSTHKSSPVARKSLRFAIFASTVPRPAVERTREQAGERQTVSALTWRQRAGWTATAGQRRGSSRDSC
jgi:hypothetical protein